MAKGKARTKLLDHSVGLVEGASGDPSWNFLYETSTVRSPEFYPGDRVTLPDGRKFVYAKATNIVTSHYQGLKFWAELGDGVGYVTADQGQAVGDSSVHITAAGITQDQLRGGYVIIHTHTAYDDQFRGILGNTATDTDGDITIFVDAPFTVAITTAFGVETYPNPFDSVRSRGAGGPGGDRYSSVAGMPTVLTTVANQYLWLQTWGPCWVNPQGILGYTVTVDRRGLSFDFEGSITGQDVQTATTSKMQYAGYIINRESSGNGTGPPVMFLQIS